MHINSLKYSILKTELDYCFQGSYDTDKGVSEMDVKKAQISDLPVMLEIYQTAREFMIKNGNPTQWGNNRPSEQAIRKDIESGHSYLILHQAEPVGVFSFLDGPDETYATIYNGTWLNDLPYTVIHKVAGSGKVKGILECILNWCGDQSRNIRIDTHEKNAIMRHLLLKNGFIECGTIITDNGTPRLAFHRYIVEETPGNTVPDPLE